MPQEIALPGMHFQIFASTRPWCSLYLSVSLDVFSSSYGTPLSSLLLALGLMIRPKTENLDVIVNISDTESWDQHVQKLNKFLERECGASSGLWGKESRTLEVKHLASDLLCLSPPPTS